MKRRRSTLTFAMALALAADACGGLTDRRQLPPEGQVLLYVDTDAWLPPAPGELEDDFAPLFHKLRFEMFAPGETTPCEGCTRDFAIDRKAVAEGRASVGFVPRAGVAGYRARVRLYRASGAGEMRSVPRTQSTIESVVALPTIGSEGVVEITVRLSSDDVGRPRGTLDAPIAAQSGPPGPSQVGTWHAEVRRGCGSEAREGEVCIRGGAFWMGDASYYKPIPERLVALSPFFIDLTEVTVGAFRSSRLAFIDPNVPDPIPHSRADHCTYVQGPSPSDALVLNCVSPQKAAEFCAARGGKLLTEAQYEYVASGFRGLTYPWGEGDAKCEDAVFARSDIPEDYDQQKRCVALGVGVAVPGTGVRDRVHVGDHDVVDLAGNVAEWMRDQWSGTDGPCWGSPAVDPVCTSGQADRFPFRGTDWEGLGAGLLAAALRAPLPADKLRTRAVGFRCMREP